MAAGKLTPARRVQKLVHAACRWYSWSRPPSRSRRRTRRRCSLMTVEPALLHFANARQAELRPPPDQSAIASSSNATATRQFAGSPAASS
jgi:hypothetical protein